MTSDEVKEAALLVEETRRLEKVVLATLADPGHWVYTVTLRTGVFQDRIVDLPTAVVRIAAEEMIRRHAARLEELGVEA